MFEGFVGSVFFEFVGALTRWLILLVVNLIRGKRAMSFKEVWGGRKDLSTSDLILHGVSNIALGTIVVVVICSIIIGMRL